MQNEFVLKQYCCTLAQSKEAEMPDYATKSYGRNAEVAAIFADFENGRDVEMPGPRRLGKSFLLDRLVDAGNSRGWHVVKAEIAGCREAKQVFRELCEAVARKQNALKRTTSLVKQRLAQVVKPRVDRSGTWYEPLINLNHEDWFERDLRTLNDDRERRWAILIDELPIFLKALHDTGPTGIIAARDFMNLFSRLRQAAPRVRWLVTGSIGLNPLAKAGDYIGVLAKLKPFELEPLTLPQACDYVMDLAQTGHLPSRRTITATEAKELANAVGWRAAFYLDAVAQNLSGEPTDDQQTAAAIVEAAVDKLLRPTYANALGTWEEHLRKHYREQERTLAFEVLAALAPHPGGKTIDNILSAVARADLTRERIQQLLLRLHEEGFVSIEDWDATDMKCQFRNPLLRRWWLRFKPQAAQ